KDLMYAGANPSLEENSRSVPEIAAGLTEPPGAEGEPAPPLHAIATSANAATAASAPDRRRAMPCFLIAIGGPLSAPDVVDRLHERRVARVRPEPEPVLHRLEAEALVEHLRVTPRSGQGAGYRGHAWPPAHDARTCRC